MNSRTLLVLLAALTILIGLAVAVSVSQRPPPGNDGLLFPELKGKLNDISKITVRTAGNKVAATLERHDAQWVVVERSGYAADLGRIRKNLRALAEAKIIEEKTSNPELYSKLGVEDVDKPAATGVQLDLTAADKTTSMIVGTAPAGGGDRAYVRRMGEKQSWLISAALNVPRDASDWLDRTVMAIPAGRVQAVTITQSDGAALRVEKPNRAAANYDVLNVPAGRQLSFPGIGNAVAGGLSDLSLDSVQPAADFSAGDVKPTVARFETFDGLVVEARTYKTPGGTQVQFSASADQALATRFLPKSAAPATPPAAAPAKPADAKAASPAVAPKSSNAASSSPPGFAEIATEAADLNARLASWIYTLPVYKVEQLSKRIDELLQPLPTDKKGAAAAGPPKPPLKKN